MGRPSRDRALRLWANGVSVGTWRIPRSGPQELLYDASWARSAEGRPISLSLPMNLDGIPLKGDEVGFYFDNLLPDSEQIRRRIRERFHTRSRDPFDLLEAVGRDCVGALQFLREGDAPQDVFSIRASALTDAEVERELKATVSSPGPGRREEDDIRISIAGAQEKTALTFHDGEWCRPLGATPTTHILKLPLGLVGVRQLDLRTSLENEWLCGRLLAAYGLPVASSEILRFGDTKTLAVKRFDRALHSSGKYWLRLPQEDFCQATGTPSHRKYESDGGPGVADIAEVLRSSESRDADLSTFLTAQLLFWMLAATDGHAKNFSIQLLAEGRYKLTPLYDVLSAWPVVGTREDQVHPKKLRLAMALRGKNRHYRRADIHRDHFNQTARRRGYGTDMNAIIEDIVARTPSVVDKVAAELRADFPAHVFETITRGLAQAAKQI